jgi:outer membrane protein assembly factor BamB
MSRISLTLFIMMIGLPSHAEDWPMLGRDRTHNAVSLEKGAPVDWQNAVRAENGAAAKAARNIKWVAKLGSVSLGGPVVANGLVWVGTNNTNPRNPALKKDASVLMCFRESDGKFLWQYVSPRLSEFAQDGPHHCMGSTPLIEGNRLWLITNRCEMLCLDITPLRRNEGPPTEVWKVDMRKEYGVCPHAPYMAAGFSPSPAADADRVFAVTGNGVDETLLNLPAPGAPSLVCFDKRTGKALWKDSSPGKSILDAQRSSPLVIDVGGRAQVVVGQGDGWLRAFDATTGKVIWKCDLNPKGAKYELGGRGRRNYVMATPVWYGGRIYIAAGQDPEHYGWENELYCVDPAGVGDVSAEVDDGRGKGLPNPNSRVLWRYGGRAAKGEDREYLFSRTMANCTVHDGLLYTCDIEGYAYCLDANTGRLNWRHDLVAMPWAGPLWAGNKVYFATDDGDVWVFAAGKDKKLLQQVEMSGPIRVTPIYANGTLYVMTNSTLYAIRGQN